jgi:tetratricopeptide (TPR) repeat protein
MTHGTVRAMALLLASGLPGSGSAGAASLTAVITQVEQAGDSAQLREPADRSILLPRPWQVIPAGARLTVPVGAHMGIACSTRHFVRIEGPASWTLDAKACSLGQLLALADYELIVPRGGRLRVIPGLLGLEQEMRGDDEDLLAPTILSPRNTALRTLRPAIEWIRIPSAVEYRIEWNGRGQDTFELRLDAKTTQCAAGWEGLEICSLPWPTDRPGLSPGQTFFLKISARDGIVAPWHEAPTVEVRTLEAGDVAKVEARLRDLQSLSLDGATPETAKAGVLAEEKLFADAAEIYRRLVASSPAGELEVTLADTYLQMGLLRLADRHYAQAATKESPAVRAAAAFGRGRIEYSRARYSEARARFREAEEMYAHEGLQEEKDFAHRAAAKAEERILQ